MCLLGDVELLLRSGAVSFPESRSEAVGSTFISISDCTRALPALAIFRKTCTEVRKNLEPRILREWLRLPVNAQTEAPILESFVKGHTLVA